MWPATCRLSSWRVHAKAQRSAFYFALGIAFAAAIASCAVAHSADHPSVDTHPSASETPAVEGSGAPATTATSSPRATTLDHINSATEAATTTAPDHDMNSTSRQNMTGLHPHLHGPPSSYYLYKLLREGGYVVFMRHAKTDVYGKDTFPDSGSIASESCLVQRNLSPAGQAAALESGLSWRILKIPVGQVHASLYCRTMETAKLMFQQLGATVTGDFSLVPTHGTMDLLGERLKQAFSEKPAPGTNNILVGHIFTMLSYDGSHVEEGEAVIAKPVNGSFVEVGRMTMIKWGDITRDYLSYGEQIFEMAELSHHSPSSGLGNATHTSGHPASDQKNDSCACSSSGDSSAVSSGTPTVAKDDGHAGRTH